MRIQRHLAFLFLVFSTCCFLPPSSAAWQYVSDGGSASAVLTDDAGDVFSAGRQQDLGAGDQSVVVSKHRAADGAVLWRYTTSDGGFAQAIVTLAQSNDSSLFAAIHLKNGSYGAFASAVARIGANGQEQWRTDFPDVGFFAVAVDSSGDVVASGRAKGSLPADPNDQDLVVIKLAGATGTEIWRYVLDGGRQVYDSREGEAAKALEIDASGDVLVAGRIVDSMSIPYHPSTPSLAFPDFLVLKLAGTDGHLVWQREIRSVAAHGGGANSLAVTANGDVIAMGEAVPDTSGWCDIVVARFASGDGTELWRTVVDTGGCDFASDVALDSTEDAFVAGTPGTTVFSVMKFSGSSGSMLWRHDIPNPGPCLGGECAGAQAIAIDPGGDAVAVGSLAGQGDFVVTKVRGSDGLEMWLRYVNFHGCDDAARVLATDPSGNVAVGGASFAPIDGACSWPNGAQYVVLELTGASGKDLWNPCQDDLDNDGDDRADYPSDPGCKSVSWPTENPACQNGLDDDGETGLDYDGGASLNAGVPLDSADPHCIGRPWRKSESRGVVGCGLGVELVFPILFLGLWRRRRTRGVR